MPTLPNRGGFSLIIKIIKDMRKYYITADKIGEFVARMYAAGIRVDAEAQSSQLVVHLPNGGYEWIHVFDKSSFDELCATFLPKSNEPNTLG